jgi:hypothetical protein
MIVVFNCPHCRRTLRADDYFSGKKIQCRTCKTILFVPGAPPVRDGHAGDAEIAAPAPEAPEVDGNDYASSAMRHEAAALGSDSPLAPDHSYGLASLYLATFSFLLFFTPALLAGMTGAIGASIAFFAGLFVNTGCFLFSWHGYQLAKKAEEMPGGQGYAAAGKMVNKFFLKFYALAFIFFLVGGIITLVYAKRLVNQGVDSMNQLKGLLGQ